MVDGARPIILLSSAASGFGQEQVLGNHRFEQNGHIAGRATVQMTRERVLNGSLEETLRVNNFNNFPVTLGVTYRFDADFADIFEVRGHRRRSFGMLSEPAVDRTSITFRYLGADGLWRRTAIDFDEPPDEINAGGATFVLQLPARGERAIGLRISVEERQQPEQRGGSEPLRHEYEEWQRSFAQISTSNEVFNNLLDRSLSDLRMLWTRTGHGHSYLAGGTPWYSTLFGRDSIITALQVLPFRPELARECLALLARHQGQSVNAETGEEPGKILHEMRNDELSAIGELPYKRYYGSADSTPLFLLLAAEYVHWTGDLAAFNDLKMAVRAGLAWLQDYGDQDGDGFIEYPTDSKTGLRNQGWKDSIDAVMHADGRICDGPVALAEVQSYVFMAYERLAPVFEHLGEAELAGALRQRAASLKQRFEEAFWLEEPGIIAMALDGDKNPTRVMSSNAGQALWGGILNADQAKRVRNALFHNDMFSGWGIRTLSSDAASYFPLGYHLGTVWPHDNGIIAMGLKRYEMVSEVNELATSLFDAAQHFPFQRLPELMGGHPRVPYHPPVPYPVACRPQAWTAGVTLHLLQAILGLQGDALNGRLHVRNPRLPYWLGEIAIRGLRTAKSEVTLHLATHQGATSTTAQVTGDLAVVVSH